MSPSPTPQRALISVYDKTGLVDFAAGLVELGWELIASAGSAVVLNAAGLATVDVADYTGSPPMLGHRVVTLHPRIHGGILADRDDPVHQGDLAAHGIAEIDLVVVNLYPFETAPSVEMIDIGGPAMLRAAAKNHAHVAVVTEPADYADVLDELRLGKRFSAARRLELAQKAFMHSACYEAAIAAWFNSEPAGEMAAERATEGSASGGQSDLPGLLQLELERAEQLRYGENPHQQAARYRVRGSPGFFDGVIQHAGPAPSYLNLFDARAAWCLVHDLGDKPAAVIVKHANPCGAAVAEELASAYSRAFDCDSRSAFGGVVATNQVIDAATADAMVVAAQADVIIAPGYSEAVIERLVARRANTRLLEAPAVKSHAADHDAADHGAANRAAMEWDLRSLGGGDFLVQSVYSSSRLASDPAAWRVVTNRQPSDAELNDAVFAWRVCAHTGSNAIVLAKDGTAWGIGAGQQNRVQAGELAAAKAAGRAVGGACASDGFYPFADGIHAAADAGAAVVVQPGGSINDTEVIAAADERNLAMLFTAERQFRH